MKSDKTSYHASHFTYHASKCKLFSEACRKDNLMTIQLNGEKIAEMDVDKWTTAGMNPDGTKNKYKYAWKDMPRKGHIGLQDHGGKVWFRNIKLKPL